MQRCPNCDESIKSDAINIGEGVALCPGCGELSRLSELHHSDRSMQEILGTPLPGCSVEPMGQGVIAIASLRSIPGFLASAGVALFWNSIVSVFVAIALAGLYANLIGPVPAWFPAPGANANAPMGIGMTLFLCLFLVPFVCIGAGMIGGALLCLLGRVEVVLDEMESFVATGVGFIRWKRKFDPRKVNAVTFHTTVSDGRATRLIEVKGDRTIKIGSMLTSDRLQWLHAVLNALILKPNGNHRGQTLPPLNWLTSRR